MDEINESLIKEIKEYINAYDEENKVIEEVILEAQAYIEATVGIAYKNNEKKVKLAKLLLKKLTATIYDSRGTQTTQVFKQDRITSTILASLSNEVGDVNV